MEPGVGTFFHWGDAGRFKSFAIGSVARRSAVVVLANGTNGMVIMPALIQKLMPGDHPVFEWLNYPRQSPPPKAKEVKDAKEDKDGKKAKESK